MVNGYAADLELRAQMLRTVRFVGPGDVLGPVGAYLASRQVFKVEIVPRAVVMPAYQFAADWTPLPVMVDVIAALEAAFGEPRLTGDGHLKDDWDLAHWMFAPNPLLADQRPYKLVKVSPKRVLQAAEGHPPMTGRKA